MSAALKTLATRWPGPATGCARGLVSCCPRASLAPCLAQASSLQRQAFSSSRHSLTGPSYSAARLRPAPRPTPSITSAARCFASETPRTPSDAATATTPRASNQAPPASTTTPQASTTTPPASTKIPRASTTTPPASTKAPPASTTTPQASTTTPPASTKIPRASTTTPPASTTTPSASKASSKPALDWEFFFRLRVRRRRIQIGFSFTLSLLSAVTCAFVLSTGVAEPLTSQVPLDPFFAFGFITIACGALGWLAGPSVGNQVFYILNRHLKAQMMDKESEFFTRIRKHRVDPSNSSAGNPVPDFYGEKVQSVLGYRRWLKDQRAFNKKKTANFV